MENTETVQNADKKKGKVSDAQRRAINKYFEKNKEVCRAKNTAYANNKYNTDEEYRKKKSKLALERYYKKKNEKAKTSDPQNSNSSDPQNSDN